GGSLSASFSNREARGHWFSALNKPFAMPPRFAFPVAWNIIYSCMGVSTVLLYQAMEGQMRAHPRPWILYAALLGLNFDWSTTFFIRHRLGLSVASIVLQLGLSTACIYEFAKFNTTSAQLLAPLQLWLVVAGVLSFDLWRKNPKFDGAVSSDAC
ncbi:uncharacterized protein MONBRDRAFT_16397, partial [Monosiga brevicollis MX1]